MFLVIRVEFVAKAVDAIIASGSFILYIHKFHTLEWNFISKIINNSVCVD